MKRKGDITYCRICGKEIVYQGKGAPGYYCSDECKRERNRRCGRASYAKKMEAIRAAEAMAKMLEDQARGHLDRTILLAKHKGLTYAEAQKLDTLSRLPKIQQEVRS